MRLSGTAALLLYIDSDASLFLAFEDSIVEAEVVAPLSLLLLPRCI